MVSFTLMQLLEDHWEELSASGLRQIHADAALKHLKALPEGELLRRARETLKCFGDWLAGNDNLAQKYEEIGRSRFEQGIPLHEVVRAQQLIKRKMINFLREQGADSALKIFAEEELEFSIDRFFDEVTYQTVRGYEAALHFHATRISAVSRQV